MSWSPAEGGREGEYEKGGKTVTVRDKMDARGSDDGSFENPQRTKT